MTKTTMTGQVGISAESLASSAKKAAKGGLPPVDKWNPEFCGDLDMRIARDGTWFYLGTPIGRHELVKLFSSILRKDGDDFFLVTPVEKVGITVDDAPFVAVDFAREGDALRFVTNVEDEVLAGPAPPIRVVRDPETGEPFGRVFDAFDLEPQIGQRIGDFIDRRGGVEMFLQPGQCEFHGGDPHAMLALGRSV